MKDKEIRQFNVELRMEARGENESEMIVGYAAVFDKLSEDLGGFREKIQKGAFKKTLNADVRALFDHDSKYVLGRTTSGTLSMKEDKEGLFVEIEPPKAQWASDLRASIDRGDINQMSFGFRTIVDEWNEKDTANVIRTLKEVELFDVSVVTYPAYPDTSVALRNLESIRKEKEAELTQGDLTDKTEVESVTTPTGKKRKKLNLKTKGN